MGKLLSPWGQQVKIEQIKRGWDNQELADASHLSREYCLSVVHGRVISPRAVEAISKAVGIPVPAGPSEESVT